MKRILFYVWLPISALLNAVSLINLQKDLLPAIHGWSAFVNHIVQQYSVIRAYLFRPINLMLQAAFEVSVPVWLQGYLVLGLVFVGSILVAAKLGNFDDRSIEILRKPRFLLVSLALYPLLVLLLAFGVDAEEDKKLRSLIYINLAIIFVAVLVILFIDFIARTATTA